jgi:hypothetical protein
MLRLSEITINILPFGKAWLGFWVGFCWALEELYLLSLNL